MTFHCTKIGILSSPFSFLNKLRIVPNPLVHIRSGFTWHASVFYLSLPFNSNQSLERKKQPRCCPCPPVVSLATTLTRQQKIKTSSIGLARICHLFVLNDCPFDDGLSVALFCRRQEQQRKNALDNQNDKHFDKDDGEKIMTSYSTHSSTSGRRIFTFGRIIKCGNVRSTSFVLNNLSRPMWLLAF
jgi:hypothetical protein